jgi:hypothetical protein
MLPIAVAVNCRVVQCQIDDGECTVCFVRMYNDSLKRCWYGHVVGHYYGLINGRKPFPVVRCVANGSRCNVCGAQIDDFHCTSGHEIDRFYVIS